MPHFHYSIRTLLGVVAYVGVACVALRYANELWASITLTLAVCGVLVAALGVLYRNREDRAFWAGFLIFGLSYLAFTFGPWFMTNLRPYLLTSLVVANAYDSIRRFEPDNPGTTVYLDSSGRVFVNDEEVAPEQIPAKLGNTPKSDVYVYEDRPESYRRDSSFGKVRSAFWTVLSGRHPGGRDAESQFSPRFEVFERTCHALLAIAIAGIGGILGRWFRMTRGDSLRADRPAEMNEE